MPANQELPVKIVATAVVALCTTMFSAAQAQVTDHEMTCADYLKTVDTAGRAPKTGDAARVNMAAEVDFKMKTYCNANPKTKAMGASMKVMIG